MSDHRHIDDETLARWIEDDLDADETNEIERALASDPELLDEATRLRDQTRLLGRAPQEDVPGDLSARIMQEVEHTGTPSRLYAFLFRPRTLTVRIATATTAIAACAAAVLLVLWALPEPPGGDACLDAGAGTVASTDEAPPAATDEHAEPAHAATDDGSRHVTFSVRAEDARHVVLVGDVNSWSEKGTPLSDRDGDGVWTLDLALEPGRYQYRFLVDGEQWLADPEADAQVDDGFGGSNSIRYVL